MSDQSQNSPYWSSIVNQLTPYVPGEQPKSLLEGEPLIKLNTNENPYPPSPKVIEALNSCVNSDLRLYPDPSSDRLLEAIATYYSIPKDQVFVGNGSDEVLAHLFCALLNKSTPIFFPAITYSFYPVYCQLYGIDYTQQPLAEDFSIRLDRYAATNGGVILPNPNAPTGRLLTLSEIESLLTSQKRLNPGSVVVIDEAYIDFGGESAIQLVSEYDNLLVVQTFSKSRSLAGLRIGFAVGQPHLIEALNRVKNCFNSYPVNRLAEAGGIAALQDKAYFEKICAKVIATREWLVKQLEERQFSVIPSSANFVLVRPPQKPALGPNYAVELAGRLRQSNVIVRHFNQKDIDHYLRITIGTDAQMQQFIEKIDRIL